MARVRDIHRLSMSGTLNALLEFLWDVYSLVWISEALYKKYLEVGCHEKVSGFTDCNRQLAEGVVK